MTRNRTSRFPLAALTALSLVAAGCGRSEETTAETDPVVAVITRSIELRSVAPVVEASGRWRSVAEFHVVAPFAAIVESLDPEVGDRVAKGQRIGWLLTRESQAALRGAEILLRQATDEASRAEARRALALARRDLTRVPLIAASPGTVSQKIAQPGAEVVEGAELLTLVPPGSLVFEAHVPLADAVHVKGGQSATVTMENGATVAVSVRTRALSTNAADQTALVWLDPSASAPPELSERFGNAVIEVGPAHRALAVPDSALVEDDLTGEQRVAVVDTSGVAIWQTVRLGLAREGWHELLAPALAPGTRVVVSGQRGLPDSTHVRTEP